MNIELKLIRPSWIGGKSEAPDDLCAHGKVKFQIDGEKLLDESEEFTVNAAALFLLRTIFSEHTYEKPVAEANSLFPCCGFNIYNTPTSDYPVVIMGCPNGADMDITHFKDSVTITSDEIMKTIPKKVWVNSVLGFANQVLYFYSVNTIKNEQEDPDLRKGWQFFWKEFHDLKKQAEMQC